MWARPVEIGIVNVDISHNNVCDDVANREFRVPTLRDLSIGIRGGQQNDDGNNVVSKDARCKNHLGSAAAVAELGTEPIR
jgi:hypothetical protein